MLENEKSKKLFSRGLLFITLAYILIQCINHYDFYFELLKHGFDMIKPFFYALILAYITYPIVKSLEHTLKIKRGFSVLLSYLTVISTIFIILNFTLPSTIKSVSELLTDLPFYLEKSQVFINNIITYIDSDLSINISSYFNENTFKLIPSFSSNIYNYITSFIGTTMSLFSSIFDFIITTVVCYYLLLEKESLALTSKKILLKCTNEKIYNSTLDFLKVLHHNIGTYLLGKVINSIFVSVSAFIVLSLLGAKYVSLLSILLGITNMIPFIGPVIGVSVATILNLFVNPLKAIFVVIALLVIQQIETFVIEPKVAGKQLGISPLLTIIAVTLGADLFGVAGAVLGVPVISLINDKISNLLKDVKIDSDSN